MSNKHRVAIIVPMYRESLSPDEEISLHHLNKHLSSHQRLLLMPEGLKASMKGFDPLYFPAQYFKNRESYSSLLLSEAFYGRLLSYTHILIYQLDCLVFSDCLDEWCERNYDYIGAPWIQEAQSNLYQLHGVGNGGFSLRKPESLLRTLETYRKYIRSWKALLRNPLRYGSKAPVYSNEDIFWSFHASRFNPALKIPDVETALSFAFELDPQLCYEKNNSRLPFGCHAWNRYDRAFWEQFLD